MNNSSNNLSADNQLKINFKNCISGQTETGYFGLGSTYLTVLQSKGQFCEIKYSNEIEGGYSTYRCTIPKQVGNFTGYEQIKSYCKLDSSGNLLSHVSNKYISLPNGTSVTIPNNILSITAIGIILVAIISFILIIKKMIGKKINKI